jgi:Protein of unknown function (DUF2716)
MGDSYRQSASADAFEELKPGEYERAWDLVYSKLGFSPSMNPGDWPRFVEPDSSITWSLAPLFDAFVPRFVEAETHIAGHPAEVLEHLRNEDAYIVALDWHHPGYRFFPGLSELPTRRISWPISVLPDGDYHLYVAADLRFGWLTHPWEQTVCCYGGLAEEMSEHLEALGLTVIRESGRPR